MEVDWNVVFGDAVTAVLKIVLPVCIAWVFKWASELWIKVKSQNPSLAAVLDYAVDKAIRASEQIFGPKHGEQKKEYAIEVVQNMLAEYGYKVNVQVIADAIESAVFDNFGHESAENHEK